MAKIKIDDLTSAVMDELNKYNKLAEEGMKVAVKKTAASVKNEIKDSAPKDTGTYAASWTSSKTFESSTTLNMVVHSKNRYQLAHLLENGHAKRGGGRVKAIPHIAPAEEKGEKMLEEELRKALS